MKEIIMMPLKVMMKTRIPTMASTPITVKAIVMITTTITLTPTTTTTTVACRCAVPGFS